MTSTGLATSENFKKQSLSTERDAWLSGQRVLQRDETSESSSQTLPASITSEETMNTSTDDSSVYSVDQDGYYTSMHTDSGVRRSSSLSSKRRSAIFLPDEDNDSQGGSFSTHSSTSTLVDKKSPVKTPIKSPKKIPPPPPPRVSTLSSASDTSSLSGSKKTTSNSNETSLSGSDTEGSGERFRYKTTINTCTYPSLCNISPNHSDDEFMQPLYQDPSKAEDIGSMNNSPIINVPKPMSLDLPSLSAFSALSQAESKKQASMNDNYMHSLPRCLSVEKTVNKKKSFLTDYYNSWPRNAASVYKADKTETPLPPTNHIVNMYQEDPSKSALSFNPLTHRIPSTQTLPTIPPTNSFKGPPCSSPIPALIVKHMNRPTNLPLRFSPEPNLNNSSNVLKPPNRYGDISANISHRTIMSPTNPIPISFPTAAIQRDYKSVPLKYAQTITVTPIPRNNTPTSPVAYRSITSMARCKEKESSPPSNYINMYSSERTHFQSPPSSPGLKKTIFVKAKSPPVMSNSKTSLTSPISPSCPGFLTSTVQNGSFSSFLAATSPGCNSTMSTNSSTVTTPSTINASSPDFNNSMTSSFSSGFGTSSTTPTHGSPTSTNSMTPTENSSGFVTPTSPSIINNPGFPDPDMTSNDLYSEEKKNSPTHSSIIKPSSPVIEEKNSSSTLTKLPVNQSLVQLRNNNKNTMSAQDLFAVIHKSKKRLSIKSEIDTPPPQSVIPIRSLSPAPRSTPETGTLTPRAATPTSEIKTLYSAKPIPYKQTSMRDFKLLLLQQKNGYRNEREHLSAAELLKAGNNRNYVGSPTINGYDTFSKNNAKHNFLNGHSTIPQFRGINRSKRHMMHDVISSPIMEDNDEETNIVPTTPISNRNRSFTISGRQISPTSTLNALEQRNKCRQRSHPSSPVDEHAVISILDSIKNSHCSHSNVSSPLLTKSAS